MKRQKGQTAVELAVFGAILIFVLGVTIRSSVSRSYQQHIALKATRMAMMASYDTSMNKDIASRNSSSVLIVEDRLTAASGKYGAIDRTPFLMQGSATHSPNLFMPIDYGHLEDLPVMDVYVNSKRFVFTTAAFKSVEIARSCANAAPCPDECKDPDSGGPPDCSASSPYYSPGAGLNPAQWEPRCAVATTTTMLPCSDVFDPTPCPEECGGVCGAGAKLQYTGPSTAINIGCAKLYTIVDNHPLISKWCDGTINLCPNDCGTAPAPGCNLSLDQRFDLNRDGVPDVTDPGERAGFSWQWYLVMGYDESATSSLTGSELEDSGGPTSVTSYALNMAEGMDATSSLDVDGDLKLESVVSDTENVTAKAVGTGGIVLSLGVYDFQEGDVDFGWNDSDKADGVPEPGFSKDVSLFTFVDDPGTYFQVDEGKLYTGIGDVRQYIRTASKKDQVDLIERTFRLSTNTGRYCDTGGAGQVTDWGSSPLTGGERAVRLTENPVEACVSGPTDCYFSENIQKTCMSTDPAHLVIYVRSRPVDLRGRKWVTETSSDPYVDLKR